MNLSILRPGNSPYTSAPADMLEPMKYSTSVLVFISAFLFATLPIMATSPTTPGLIEPPADQELKLTLIGRGVQIYRCTVVPGSTDKFEWTFKAPEANLFDKQGRKVGRHFAGPSWELSDGNKVTGRVTTKIDAPDGKGIPWLLLDAVQASGVTFGKVQTIQRVDTVGGKEPSMPVDASSLGKEMRVEYSATYKFYGR
jgi:Protein of unknown function (DUF3455)